MMKFTFEDVLAKIEYNIEHKNSGFNFPLLPELNKIIGNISSNIYTAIGGLPGSGTTSVIDQNYVLGPLIQWYLDKDDNKKNLKILYFSLQDDELRKIQQLICSFCKLASGIHIDIPTLNSRPGRLYNIEDEQSVKDALNLSKIFFDDVLENQLTIITGEYSPTDIHNKIVTQVDDDTTIIAVVDSVRNLNEEQEKFGTLRDKELDKKMDSIFTSLSSNHGVNVVAAIPIKSSGGARLAKDNEPHYNQLGAYINCHRGIIVYDPVTEKNPLYSKESSKFINSTGLNTLRTWTVVRNTEGKNAVSRPFVLLPGTSFMQELDSINDIIDFADVKNILLTPNTSPYFGSLG